MTATTEEVWEGAEALRPFLVPVGELEPFPGNPRRGDVAKIRESLRRFGQTRPLLITEEGRLVAGHHVRLAAIEEGWTHVAVLPNAFKDEAEARAYLVADNRLPELGGYDVVELVEHLRLLADLDGGLVGTGYDDADLTALQAQIARQEEADSPLPEPPPPPEPMGEVRELVLAFTPERYDDLSGWLKIVAKEERTEGASDTVYAAVKLAARDLNIG